MLKFVFLIICLVPGIILAGTIHVPSEYPTIQAAIDAGDTFDTVLVGAGTYTGDGNRDISFNGKVISVISESGPETAIIDCQGQDGDHHRGFIFNNNEANGSVVDGFTIKNGWGDQGAGIFCSGSSPIINNCIFEYNVGDEGAGIYCENNSLPLISNCMFFNNHALLYGAGILCNNSSPSICNSTFSGNHGYILMYGYGAGLYCMNSSNPVVQNNIFAYNGVGGGIMCEDENSIPTIECTNIFGNYTHNWDGYISSQLLVAGNLSEEPCFINQDNDNYYLKPESPCLPANNDCGLLIGARGAGPVYFCGDINTDGGINILDITFLIYFLYYGGFPLPIYEAADVNYDGTVNLLDVTYLIAFLYSDGPDPDCEIPTGSSGGLFGHSSCGGFADKSTVDDSLDCIQYEYDGESLLTIHHLNAGLNCCPLIDAIISVEDNLIIIEETDDTGPFGGCFCLCLFDIDYYITDLPPGIYTIRFVEPHIPGGDDLLEVTVDLITEPTGMHCVNRCFYPWYMCPQ